MKKQNVNNKLAFNKAVVAELNDSQLYDVNGGATPATIIASSAPCAALASAVVGSIVAWLID
jgi:lactobin A/cerein 7B family class IIb bacteriocin